MKLTLWAAFAALTALAPGAGAQQSVPAPHPADPSVAVPAIVYQSVLTSPVAPASGAQTPDKHWRAANDALAGHGGHGSHAAPPPAPAQEAPCQAAPARDQHQHH